MWSRRRSTSRWCPPCPRKDANAWSRQNHKRWVRHPASAVFAPPTSPCCYTTSRTESAPQRDRQKLITGADGSAISDRRPPRTTDGQALPSRIKPGKPGQLRKQRQHCDIICLLYTSDAADDLLCVDLGGRR